MCVPYVKDPDSVCVCMRVCVRARMCACVYARVRAHARVFRMSKILTGYQDALFNYPPKTFALLQGRRTCSPRYSE